MKLRRSIQPLGSAPDLTALVNVVLLLLVFFLIGSAFVVQPGIKINPPAGVSRGGVSDVHYVINITAQEQIFFNNQSVSVEQLTAELRQLAAAQPGVYVVVRADEKVPYGSVAAVMKCLFDAGVSNVLNATQ